ncbi:MAG: efflux RND transporter periplasmic adaptor subunit [Planctomycetaceae bacterium]|nr:efflux RND transporter periplasmic adaptor subunit [Planctomycetaceae bacterium]
MDKEKLKNAQQRLLQQLKIKSEQFTNFRKRHRQFTISAIVIIAGVLLTIIMIAIKKSPAKESYPEVAPLVKTSIVSPRNIEMVINGYGTVKPKSQVQIVPQVAGKVVLLNPLFRAGGVIKAGQELFRIEPKDYELAVEQAQANVAEAEVKLDIEKSEAAVAKREWHQINPDSEPNSMLVLREPQIKQAQAMLDSTKAALSKAKLNLERTSITLPIDTCVTEKKVDLGQYIAAGQSVGSAYGTDAVEIEVPLEDGELAWFDMPGSIAEVKADFAGAARVFNGQVKRTTGQVDEFSRLVHVVVEVANHIDEDGAIKDALLPGTFVTIGIKGKTFKNAFAIKRDWIRNGEEIWTVEDDVLSIMPVEIVRADEEYAYIKTGSNDAIEIVTGSVNAVVDGMKIRISSENK